MFNMKNLISASVFACVAMTGAASAATINIFNDTDITASATSGVDALGLRGTVTCTQACSALYYTGGAYEFRTTSGEMFDGPPNSGDSNEALWVNSVILSVTGTNPLFTGTEVGSGYQDSGDDFISDALYVIMKIGNKPDYLMIRNDYTGTDAQTFSYAKADGASGGLSHSFGLGQACVPSPANNFCNDGPPVSVIPLPASLPLLLGAFGVFGIASRRKSRKAA